jgi:methylmalonyl-CoA mutase cobalamin-binding domain/chain
MGIDSDSPRALGEVGRVGVAIDTVEDMHVLLDGLPLDTVSTSMTINATASTLLAMYIVVAEERGIDRAKLSGTIQNDILKEYIARGTYIYPPEPSLALVADIFRFCAAEVPNWNPISISGYHIREAGATGRSRTGIYVRQCDRVCAASHRRGTRRRCLRSPPLVLLRRAQRPVRGSGKVSRGAPDLCAAHARTIPRQ